MEMNSYRVELFLTENRPKVLQVRAQSEKDCFRYVRLIYKDDFDYVKSITKIN